MNGKSNKDHRTRMDLLEELEQLRGRLDEAEQISDAIRSGEVDALVVTGASGDKVYSLTGVDQTYRLIIETMNQAALTVSLDGTILFCNQRFCNLVKSDMLHTIGQKLTSFFEQVDHPSLQMLLADAQAGYVQRRHMLRSAAGSEVSLLFSASLLLVDSLASICLLVTDLAEMEARSNSIRDLCEQQQVMEQSRAELLAANNLLEDSRRAALNILEDTVASRRVAEESTASLQSEVFERKLVEEALRKAHDELELRVRERTEDLIRANARLKQEIEDRKRAEESLQVAYKEISGLKDRFQEENIYLKQEVAQEYNFGQLIGQSSALSKVFLQVEQVAPMNATVLLHGETGTGKGVVARAIHSNSTRKDKPMITVNCTALPANLIESELFGRERGAFTGANARQMGRFELADGGTIFLDEIGEMPLDLQCRLLRVIQDGEFERLGSPRTIKVDVRIIAATNRNLEEEMRNGMFREDLYYRLNVFPITIPPLRQRKEDIPLLVAHFVEKFNKKNRKKIDMVSKETLNALQEYHWPGNVRELESVIERAVITSQGKTLQVLDRFDMLRKTEEPSDQDVKALSEMEQDHIQQVLRQTGWRIEGKNGAALLLGLNPSTLRARMRKYGIQRQ